VLSVVPTPIGNRQDITLRAVEVLKTADLIAAEDTRHSGLLLQHLGIRKPFLSLHGHNESFRCEDVANRISGGLHVALITDAGMPGISDPGYRLIRTCIDRGLQVSVLPGPSAVLTALVGSGFPCDRFFFGGFLPVKSGRRSNELTAAAARSETSIYFESPHRILKTLATLDTICPGRTVCVARELTKTFEEYRREIPSALIAHFEKHPPKGEITLVIPAGSSAVDEAVSSEDDD
jgi:16S rRNA (cytidine1402-2'-O)-methyltransferase